MTISLITAVYNRVATIGQALDSVAQQTYSNIEHVIVDGGSTDGTLGVIAQRQTPAMRVISEPDEGIYDALNKGMRLARGEIIGLVHSDDFLANDAVIAAVSQAFAVPGIDAVYGDLDYVAADDPAHVVRRWRAGRFSPASLRRGWMPPHPALFIRRQVFEIYGGYDTSYRIAADYEAILRWFGAGAIRAAYLPEVLVKMRVGGESNRTVERIWRKSCEDYRALRAHRVGGLATLACKNISKVPQFWHGTLANR